jgi:hypothetical protein
LAPKVALLVVFVGVLSRVPLIKLQSDGAFVVHVRRKRPLRWEHRSVGIVAV